MTNYLVIVYGFFGDIAFSTSVARKLLEEKQCDSVDYLIGLPQMKDVLDNDKNISNVFVSDPPGPYPKINIDVTKYNKVIKLGQMNFDIPPPVQMQLMADIKNVDSEFYLNTNPEYDSIAKQLINDLRKEHNKPVVCVMSNWEERSFLFTEEQYKKGIDVPGFGYGGKHRNIKYIIDNIIDYVYPIEVGFPSGTTQLSTVNISSDDQKSLLFECSLMKFSDGFLGAEGGLCNLAAGVGCRTIITGDFVHQLYGYNGCVKKIKEPKLGPIHYFNNKGHVEFDPYLTDKQVVEEIIKIYEK